jgi:ribulose-phosphate 3-epimerase
MKAWVSLWSADQLVLREAIDSLDGRVAGFHLDIMDGHFVRELLYGPDTVRAVSERATVSLTDVHLMVAAPDQWIKPFIEAGADVLTVHPETCHDVRASLRLIQGMGAQPSVALSLAQSIGDVAHLLEAVDRVVVMGTPLGIKGASIDESIFSRVRELTKLRARTKRRPEIVVDGGIREDTVVRIAEAGADGVVPGSLVFANSDWREAVEWIKSLPVETAQQ